MDAIRKGLGLQCPRGRKLHVDQIDKTRNWEEWVADLGVAISGYTSPGSSHSTRLIRRKGLLTHDIACMEHAVLIHLHAS